MNVLAELTMSGNNKYRITDTKTVKISLINHHKYSSLALMLYINTNLPLLRKSEKTNKTIPTSNKLCILTCFYPPTRPEF